ncbi:alanine racemase [Microbacterium lacticum]
MSKGTGMYEDLIAFADAERALPLTLLDKPISPEWAGLSGDELVTRAPRLSAFSTPLFGLDAAAMSANIGAMAAWTAEHSLSLAPHGKTTMSPALWLVQLQAGAWAITVANEAQVRVARAAGVPRVILANMLLRPEGVRWVADELARDPGFEFFCWVDSVEAVRQMDRALGNSARRPIPVLLELGHDGSRTGLRDDADAAAIVDAIASAPGLDLVGVAGYEGVIAHDTTPTSLALVDRFLDRMAAMLRDLRGRLPEHEAILSGGGSTFFDRVAERFEPIARDDTLATRVVIRSGAYIVHDDGFYRASTPAVRGAGPELRAAMFAWARVLSIPEPGVAYLDAGRRDLPFDEGWPEPQLAYFDAAGGDTRVVELTGHRVTGMNDQHTHVRWDGDSPLAVGARVRLGLSHPCTAFDKWAVIPVFETASGAEPRLVDVVRTHF